jgi:threonylcarbamoyladenosine tRNA methylthiotransferase MtaB
MDPMNSVQVQTFGCKVNTYDSGLLQKKLSHAGFELSPASPSVYVLNSCAVTAEATKEALRTARKIKKEQPGATVVLTGCAAQVDGALVDQADGVDLVIANSHKQDFTQLLKDYLTGKNQEKVHRSNIFRNEDLGEGGGEELGHTRSYLKIQDGCNSFCSFCVIPFARGKSRSLPVPTLLDKIRSLSAQGVNEVVLTGVHIGDYLDEQTPGGPFALDDLVEQVLRNTSVPRIRLTSLEPVELTDKLMGLYKNPRLCPHFHMSIQSLSTPILHAMRRNYNEDQVKESLFKIQAQLPHAFVGLDVIVGFPGETEELFQRTLSHLQQWPWSRIHVFPYSERSGTRAEKMADVSVPWPERKQRAKILQELSRERYHQKALDQLGSLKNILLLGNNGSSNLKGLSEDYWPVHVDRQDPTLAAGSVHPVKIKGFERGAAGSAHGFLWGELQ